MVAFLTRRLSRARRNAGTVRTMMGLRDIRARSVRSRRHLALTVGGDVTLSRPMLRRQAGSLPEKG
jgi:hypothetical protein